MKGKLWGGRFSGRLLPELEAFSSSLEVDSELYPFDVAGSLAHARGLHVADLLDADRLREVEEGLRQVRQELDGGTFEFRESDEDIHTAVERRLTEVAPEAGTRLHAGRSRNDQIALDLRLYCRAAAGTLVGALAELVTVLAARAQRHAGWPMPGYTHLQRAQPVTVGHHLLVFCEQLLRDARRAQQAYDAADEMPLGAGALAGSTLSHSREVAAQALGFRHLTRNSIDAVSDRDFVLDLIYACTTLGIHLSQLGEDVVIWSSAEFGFIRLADEISTGSSIMPQKKNPDIAELLRGRSGRALGALIQLATVLKGLPRAYDKDLQEDKGALFLAVDNAIDCVEAARLMAEHLVFDAERMGAALDDPDLLATDTAEKLVADGMPFRAAHREVGRQVMAGEHRPPWDARRSLEQRDMVGAPKPARVRSEAHGAIRRASTLARWASTHPPELPV
ncbi:MAG: argininosuccinate lyase [Candidatus Dormibacteraeota bacterium]|nr:argininosuccinate lyase [Candidatus Dormibacteraeota bacterium]